MTGRIHPFSKGLRGGLCLAALLTASACDNGQFQMPSFATRSAETPASAGTGGTVELIERDVEAPEVFQVTEAGLWDGRPSLGGVWVAHPDVTDPERVIIRNRDNGQFVIGALFRRERENPGPRLQVSSDAAEALGVLAGAPTDLNVTALRREEGPADPAPVAADPAEMSDLPAMEATAIAAPASVETTSLDPIASATAAIEAAELAATPAPTPVAATPAPAPAPAAAASSLDKPFIQIGIFSIEDNANRTADRMRGAGIVPTVLHQESQGREFWRVIVGPARNSAERTQLLDNVISQGFADAYAVTN